MRAKTWAPVATFVAVAAVGVTAAVVHDGGDGGRPGSLHLAAGAKDTAARSATSGGTSGYTLGTDLSDAKPDPMRSETLSSGPAPQDVVARLATALRAGDPKRDGDGWRAGGLVVSGKAGRAWSWSECGAGPDTAVSSDGSTVSSGCAVAVPGTAPSAVSGGSSGSSGSGVSTPVAPSPVPAPSLPPPVASSVVEDGARDVLQAVGLDVADATIDTTPYGGSATVEAGPDVAGMTTRVDVDRSGKVTNAAGWLGTRTPGDSYPLISAQDAFDQLPMLAYPDICRLSPDGKGCLEPEPVVITGARLGLSLQPTTDGGSVLVPSWLFALKAGGTIAAVAVEEQYRTDPVPQASDDPGTMPTSVPGSTDPAPPPTGGREPVVVQGYQPGTGSSLVVLYDNGGCGHKNLTAQAKEDETTVYVVLEADAVAGDMACTQEYREEKVTVDLQAPLGTRKVVDASTNQPVPLAHQK